jgi:hypothetical protein
MEWFHSTERDKQGGSQDNLASSHEIQSAFVEQRDYLNWIALIITGDHALADPAVINASDLSASHSSVFRDWLIAWTNTATVRAAIREVRALILHRRAVIPIRPASTLMMRCFLAIRSLRFGMSIHKTSLRRLTYWPAPHWCCGEYNVYRLLIARSCWICRDELSRLRIAGLSVGMTSVGVPMERRMKMGRFLAFDYTLAENTIHDQAKRENVLRINKTKMRTRHRAEW